MKVSKSKKICLSGLIVFLSLSALLTIFFLLTGTFNSIQIKIIVSMLILSCASIMGLAAMAFIEKRMRPGLGYSGIFCITVSALLLIFGIWIQTGNEFYWQIVSTLSIISCAAVYSFLVSLPDISENLKWTYITALICVLILSILVLFPIWFSFNRGTWYFRVIGVVSTIQALLTIVIPILSRISPSVNRKSLTGKQGYPRVGIGVILENPEGKILIGKRRGAHAPYYSIPGGALDQGETFESCALREIKEETGLEIESPEVIGITNNLETFRMEKIHFVSVILYSNKFSGKLKLREPKKCEGWLWIDPLNLPQPHFDASAGAISCFLNKKFYVAEQLVTARDGYS